jgi:hypothetical protein
VCGSARPIGALPSPESGSLIVAQTVVSVGPYALIIRRPRDQRTTSSSAQASPATINASTGTSSSIEARIAGGNVACVTRSRRNSSVSG